MWNDLRAKIHLTTYYMHRLLLAYRTLASLTQVALRSIPVCTCRICEVARTGGAKYRKTLMGKRGRHSAAQATPTESCKVCSHCFARIYRGSNHSAGSCKFSRKARVDNIEELVKSPTSL